MTTAFPKLTTDILSLIVSDAVKLCSDIEMVGVVGSFARGDHKHSSDVDLIVKVKSLCAFQDVLETFGEYVRHVLDYQFNKRLDIIRYDLAIERSSRNPGDGEAWFYREGFEQMLREVKWLYEGSDYHYESAGVREAG